MWCMAARTKAATKLQIGRVSASSAQRVAKVWKVKEPAPFSPAMRIKTYRTGEVSPRRRAVVAAQRDAAMKDRFESALIGSAQNAAEVRSQ